MGTFARTGRVSFPYTTTSKTIKTASAPQVLCTYQEQEARLLTLMVSLSQQNAYVNTWPASYFAPCNLGMDEVGGMTLGQTGILVLEYGSGSAMTRVFADLKTGAYALPPCEFAQASVQLFHPHAAIGSPGIDVAGTLLEGQHKHAARFTASLVALVDPAWGFAGSIPAQARWVDLEGGNTYPALNTVTPAKVRFLEQLYVPSRSMTFGAGRYLVRDEAAGIFPDPMPVELGCPGGSGNGPATFRVWNDGAAEALITVKFFLEL